MPAHKARKRFGQHFLVDNGVIDAILRAVDAKSDDHVVEIGPGQRALTDGLAARAGQLTLLELDRDLVARLQQAYAQAEHIRIISTDALAQDFGELGSDLRIVGNLPYNISTPLLFHLLEYETSVQDMHFMLQKEVVDRIVARAGDKAYGRLGVMLGCKLDAQHLLDVPPEAFDPPPRVQSAVVRLRPLPQARRLGQSPVFPELVKRAFAMRRKTLRNTLRELLTAEQIESVGIDSARRAETLSIEEFDRLANIAD
jgi:16S rRNA (adenine1518-N6/adenine1519-N6)-dimethyltransferase